jgi:glycosyltransferase involved in cell wall biosynthesis
MTYICMVAYATHTDERIRREAESLVARGDSVDYICLGDEQHMAPEFQHGVRIIQITVSRYQGSSILSYIASYIQFFLKASIKLAYLQLKNSYDVVQVHTMPDFMVFAAAIPKLLGAKIVLDIHDLMPELFQSKFGFSDKHPSIRFITWIERISVRFADRAIAVHKPHLEALCRHGNPCDKFSILLNVPDMRMFPLDERLPIIPNSSFDLIYHGTVSRRHGLEVAIRAISALKGKIKNLKLSVIGAGDDMDRLSKLVDELDLREHVSITSTWMPIEQLGPIIRRANVGVVPILADEFTRYMLPVKLLEYVGLSIPVICSRTPTIEAYFDDSMVQYTSPGSVNELATGILYLYENPDRRAELKSNSSKFNLEYNWEKQKQAYYELIDHLSKKRSVKLNP